MKNKKTPDFSGYATKYDIKCTDGRVIKHDAFGITDGTKLPLVWQHMHSSPDNILGTVILENRPDGLYASGYFNNSNSAKSAKEAVEHGDIDSMSIWANNLVQKGSDVIHGKLREVSLVLSGANPGALIQNVSISHGDGDIETIDDEAIIYSGLVFDGELAHEDTSEEEKTVSDENKPEDIQHADDETIDDVVQSMSEKQRTAMYYIISQLLDDSVEHSDEEGEEMKKNVFDKETETLAHANTLTNEQVGTIFADAARVGSLKESILSHAAEYGIEDIDFLFPEYKNIQNTPEIISRRMEWVDAFMSKTSKTPFAKVKTMGMDITADEARAKGYVKGNLKKE